MRTKGKILKWTAVTLAGIIAAVLIVAQLPSVQTAAAKKVVAMLQEKLDGDLKIDAVGIKPFTTLVLKGILVVDRHPCCAQARDTLARIDYLSAKFSLLSLLNPDGIRLHKVHIKGVEFNFVTCGKQQNNINSVFRLTPKEKTKLLPEKDVLKVDELSVEGVVYNMQLLDSPSKGVNYLPGSVLWHDLGVTQANFRAENIRIGDRRIWFDVPHMDFREKSGWHVTHLSCTGSVSNYAVMIKDITLQDDTGTDVLVDYTMSGRKDDYQDYVHKVVMEATIHGGRWSQTTLSYVIPQLRPGGNTFYTVLGSAKGPVSDLRTGGIRVGIDGTCTSALLKGRIYGITDTQDLGIDASVSSLRLHTCDIQKALKDIAPGMKADLGKIAEGEEIQGSLETGGRLDNFSALADLSIKGGKGSARVSARMKNLMKHGSRPITIKGNVECENLNLESILSEVAVNDVTMRSDVSVSLPDNKGSLLEARADTLVIKSAFFNSHRYKDISGSVALKGEDLTANLVSRDEDMDADISIWSDEKAYNASINLGLADLYELGLLSRSGARMRTTLEGRLEKDSEDRKAEIKIKDTYLGCENGTRKMKDIVLNARKKNGIYDIALQSDLMKAVFTGNGDVMEGHLGAEDLSAPLSFLMPGLYLSPATRLDVKKDSTGVISIHFESGRIALRENYLKDVSASACGTLQDIEACVKTGSIKVGKMEMDDGTLFFARRDSLMSALYTFENPEGMLLKTCSLDVGMTLGKNGRMDFDIRPSFVESSRENWEIPASAFSIDGGDIIVDNLCIRSADKLVHLDGKVSTSAKETLCADIRNLDIDVLNDFIEDWDLGIGGRLTASGELYSPVGVNIPGITLNAVVDSASFGGCSLGRIDAKCIYDIHDEDFKITLTDEIGGRRSLTAEMDYIPEDHFIDASLEADDFPISPAMAFIPSVTFSALEGRLSGKITAGGKADDLNFSSEGLRIDNGMLQVAFTRVPYYVDGTFSIDNSGIHLGEINARDRYSNALAASGGVYWNQFKNIRMGMHFDFENAEVTNIPADGASLFYGNIFGGGAMDLTGPFGNLVLSADARTKGNSDMHFAFSHRMDATKGDLLTFYDPLAEARDADPYERMLKEYRSGRSKKGSKFIVRLHALADPGLEVGLDFGASGFAAGITGRGNGVIDMDLNTTTTDFTILGDYTLSEGTFGINVSNLVRRDFQINSGSSIKFVGDIWKSALDVNASYETKASISSLIADTTSVSNRRIVKCGIRISDELRDPGVKLSIDIPDLDPSVKSTVESALSTDDKVQKQFLSLLLSNNFLPDEQNSIVSNSSLLYSNVSEIMANQVNNIFTKLDIPLDLGLNYQPTSSGKSIFDVALSTQLFNNRVVIGGSLGNRQNSGTGRDDVIGDLDIQYKVNRSGALRLKAFSHSADQYSNYLDNSQRNGVGITWQQEFDNFSNWIKTIFSRKEVREERKAEYIERDKKMKTISAKND